MRTMDQRDFIRLTAALYRVTEDLPDLEPLKPGLREWGLKVLTTLLPYRFLAETDIDVETADEGLKAVQTLRCLMEVSQGQRWIDQVNLLLLDQEYSRLEDLLKDIVSRLEGSEEETEREIRRGPIPMRPNVTYNLNSPPADAQFDHFEPVASANRQGKILEMIRHQPRIQMRQIQEKLNNVTSRTLRRDLDSLVRQGKITRIGRGTGTYYQMNFVDNS